MSNKGNSVIYTGVTGDLFNRVLEHKNGKSGSFTSKYKCAKLVYFEEFQYINEAIDREKEIKGWSRKKKEDLIHSINPLWEDLSVDWL